MRLQLMRTGRPTNPYLGKQIHRTIPSWNKRGSRVHMLTLAATSVKLTNRELCLTSRLFGCSREPKPAVLLCQICGKANSRATFQRRCTARIGAARGCSSTENPVKSVCAAVNTSTKVYFNVSKNYPATAHARLSEQTKKNWKHEHGNEL